MSKSNRRNSRLPAAPQNKNQQKSIVVTSHKEKIFSGPIPSPDILKGYAELDIGYPERIL
ncbi:MAG: hypothetical protein FWG92_01420 [Leptospirales bacterium]|nr:hypothetical protein [Leptospirales bacterium]